MSTLLIIILLAAAFGCLTIVLSCMVMSGHISEIERWAEIEAVIMSHAESAEDKDQSC